MTQASELQLRDPEPHYLCSGWDETPKSAICGELIRRATSGSDSLRIAHYHGDFYYDADWLRRHLPDVLVEGDPFIFWFGFDNWGTAVGTDAGLVQSMRKRCFKVICWRDGYRQGVSFQEVIR